MGVGRKQERYNGRMSMTADNTTRPRKKGPIAIEGARIVGFALLLAWFSASGFLVSSATANSADFLTLVAFTALLFIAAFVGRSRDIRRQATILCSVFSAVAAVGTIVPSFTADSPIISIICSLLTAPGLALLVLGWGSLFSKRSMPTVILETIAAQLLMSAIHLTGCLQPPHLEAILRGIYLIGSAFMFAIAAKATQPTKLSHLLSGQHDHSQSATKWQPFVRFIIAINLWGAAINLLYNIYRYCAPLDFEDLSAPAALIEIALLGLLLVVASRQRVKDTQLYTIIFATVLLAFLLVPILGIQNTAPFYALFLGFAALSVLTWTLSAQICQAYQLSSNMVYGCAIGSFLGLQIVIARAIARDAFSGIASSPIELNTLCLIGAFASFAAYQLVFNHRSAIWSEPSETMQEAATDHSAEGDACANAEAVADPFERWDDFAALYHLTPRESEVLLLFARGRSYERIQETLVIARGTVNYHMSNAYRKIGISSRQDLLDRLDEAACSNERK